jgi:2'-hydroxyisoflavone reductase
MKLLVLGGTRFLGRHLVQQALELGHDVTLLHRGVSGPMLFPDAQHLIADRNADLSPLHGDTWDVAIDTNADVPRHVHSMAAALGGRVGVYQLVSSISVYAKFDVGQNEDSARATLADPTIETIGGDTYGSLKALCEDAAQAGFGGRCLIARPGLIVGPFDPTGRFNWWVQRIAKGAAAGPVLAPGEPTAQVQFIDARDCAAWLLLQATRGTTGTFNLTGPNTALTMADLLRMAQQTLGNDAPLQWLTEAFLLTHGVTPWTELPLWLPQESAGLHHTNIRRALASGLQCRPLSQTIADTAAWVISEISHGGAANKPGIGITAEREAALLQAWVPQGS